MKQQLLFLTSNPFKLATAQQALQPFGLGVQPLELNIPEIQAETNAEIALHTARIAAQQLGQAVMREDHGFYLQAFPGWPGPYMAHTERHLPPAELLRLLEGKERGGYFEMALAYVEPEGQTWQFAFQLPIHIATEIRSDQTESGWDSIICLGQDQRTLSEYPPTARYHFFANNFVQLAKKITQL